MLFKRRRNFYCPQNLQIRTICIIRHLSPFSVCKTFTCSIGRPSRCLRPLKWQNISRPGPSLLLFCVVSFFFRNYPPRAACLPPLIFIARCMCSSFEIFNEIHSHTNRLRLVYDFLWVDYIKQILLKNEPAGIFERKSISYCLCNKSSILLKFFIKLLCTSIFFYACCQGRAELLMGVL